MQPDIQIDKLLLDIHLKTSTRIAIIAALATPLEAATAGCKRSKSGKLKRFAILLH